MSAPFYHQNGKEWLVNEVRQLFGPDIINREFYDLYCGGLNIALGLKNPRTVAVDHNPYIIEFYKLLQRGVYYDPDKQLIWTSKTEVPFAYGADAYSAYINQWNGIRRELTDECLIIFYLLTQMSFKQIIRFSGAGDFNLPFGRSREESLRRRLMELPGYVYKFQGWRFLCQDVNRVAVPSSAAVYIDPPYSGGFSNYRTRAWSSGDRELLASRFEHHAGPIVISDTIAAAGIYTDRGYSVRKVIHNSIIELVACRNLAEAELSKFLKVSHLETVGSVV